MIAQGGTGGIGPTLDRINQERSRHPVLSEEWMKANRKLGELERLYWREWK